MKKIIFLLFLTANLYLLTAPIFAADLDVTCRGAGTCLPDNPGPIFPSSEVWYPGKTASRSIKLLNTSGGSQKIITQAIEGTTTEKIDEVFQVSILRDSDKTVMWAGTLHQFYQAGEKELVTLGDGVSDSFIYTASMDTAAGNQYQGQETKFDLQIGFLGIPSSGSSPSAPSCNDSKPGSAPVLTSAVAGTNSVTLFWNEAIDPVTYYLVAYGNYGNPNVGGKGTTSYTVSNLSGGITYTFRVRAGNGCKPGDFSNELSATPGGGVVVGPATGFIPGVLGEATPSAVLATQSGEIVNLGNPSLNIPWWIYVGGTLAGVFLFFFIFWLRHRS